jgi:hypothetical protein
MNTILLLIVGSLIIIGLMVGVAVAIAVVVQRLVEKHGWTVAAIDYGHPERMVTLMPIMVDE